VTQLMLTGAIQHCVMTLTELVTVKVLYMQDMKSSSITRARTRL